MLKYLFSPFFLALVSIVIANMVLSCPNFQPEPMTDFDGANIDKNPPIVTDYEACCTRCLSTAGCVAFSFTTDLKQCRIKKAKGKPAQSTNTISGYNLMSCLDFKKASNTDYPGNDLTNGRVDAVSADDCCAKCAADPACNAYTFVPNNCYKKSAISAATTKTGATSGYRQSACPDFTTADGTAYDGNDLTGYTAYPAISYGACCSRCYATTGCNAFDYNSATQNCFLKSARGTCIKNSNWKAGYSVPSCDDFQRQNNIDYIGVNLPSNSYVTAKNYQECCASCARTPGCNAFTYEASSLGCWRKTGKGTNNPSKTGVVSAYRQTPVQWGCFEKGTCTGNQRQYCATLMNVPAGSNATYLCQNTPVTLKGTSYPGAASCTMSGSNVVGCFNVVDGSCC